MIEAKGQSKSIGVDFKTAIGQIIFRMDNDDYKYGIAVPNTKQYLAQINKVPDLVIERLRLVFLLLVRMAVLVHLIDISHINIDVTLT